MLVAGVSCTPDQNVGTFLSVDASSIMECHRGHIDYIRIPKILRVSRIKLTSPFKFCYTDILLYTLTGSLYIKNNTIPIYKLIKSATLRWHAMCFLTTHFRRFISSPSGRYVTCPPPLFFLFQIVSVHFSSWYPHSRTIDNVFIYINSDPTELVLDHDHR